MKCTIKLISVGTGTQPLLTAQAAQAIAGCDCLFGAARLLQQFALPGQCTLQGYQPEQLLDYLAQHPIHLAGVLLSGDAGFFSAAQSWRDYLTDHQQLQKTVVLETLPGISSVLYLAARMGESWQQAGFCSLHGKSQSLLSLVRDHPKSFVLCDGKSTPQWVCQTLTEHQMGGWQVTVGERLSYPDERITTATAQQLVDQSFDGFATVFVCPPNRRCSHALTPGMFDDVFVRGQVPMTKQEVRALSICRLRPMRDSICYDIGAGTGSVSVELARLCYLGQVYAVERNPDACALIEQNRRKFGLPNLQVMHATAPQALAQLPAPDCAFIGGSGGNLAEIVAVLLQKNARVRLVINAITLETALQGLQLLESYGCLNLQCTQLGVCHVKKAGRSHMMCANNPIYILGGEGAG